MQRAALLFSNDIPQYATIGKYLYNEFDYVKHIFEEASDHLKFDISGFFSQSLLNEKAAFQFKLPAALTCAVMAYKVLTKEMGFVPCCVAGEGLGEYAALTCSGVIKFSDALSIVKSIPLPEIQADSDHDAVLGQIQSKLGSYTLNRMRFTVVSGRTGLPYEDEDDIAGNFAVGIKDPAVTRKVIDTMIHKGAEILITIGSDNKNAAFVETCAQNLKMYCFNGKPDIAILEKAFNIPEDRKKMISRCLALAACTRNRNWNEEEYRTGVIDTYNRIKEINDMLEKSKAEPTIQQMEEALENLVTIFRTKKVPESEQTERLKLLFRETGTDGLHLLGKNNI